VYSKFAGPSWRALHKVEVALATTIRTPERLYAHFLDNVLAAQRHNHTPSLQVSEFPNLVLLHGLFARVRCWFGRSSSPHFAGRQRSVHDSIATHGYDGSLTATGRANRVEVRDIRDGLRSDPCRLAAGGDRFIVDGLLHSAPGTKSPSGRTLRYAVGRTKRPNSGLTLSLDLSNSPASHRTERFRTCGGASVRSAFLPVATKPAVIVPPTVIANYIIRAELHSGDTVVAYLRDAARAQNHLAS